MRTCTPRDSYAAWGRPDEGGGVQQRRRWQSAFACTLALPHPRTVPCFRTPGDSRCAHPYQESRHQGASPVLASAQPMPSPTLRPRDECLAGLPDEEARRRLLLLLLPLPLGKPTGAPKWSHSRRVSVSSCAGSRHHSDRRMPLSCPDRRPNPVLASSPDYHGRQNHARVIRGSESGHGSSLSGTLMNEAEETVAGNGGAGHVSEAAGRLSLLPSDCRPLLCGAEQTDEMQRRRQLNASGTSDLNGMDAMVRETSISLAGRPIHAVAAAASWLVLGRRPLGNHVAGFGSNHREVSVAPNRVGTLMEDHQRDGGFFGPIRGQGHTMAAVAAVAEVRGGMGGVGGMDVDDEGSEEDSKKDSDERRKEGRRMDKDQEENRRSLYTPGRGGPFQPCLASHEGGLDEALLVASHESFPW